MTAANQNLAGLYNMGFGLGGKGAAAMTGAGAAIRLTNKDASMTSVEPLRATVTGLNLAGNTPTFYALPIRAAHHSGVAANTTTRRMAALSGGQQGSSEICLAVVVQCWRTQGQATSPVVAACSVAQQATPRSIRHLQWQYLATTDAGSFS